MLTYPGFSVVFIQTFSLDRFQEFSLPERAVKEMKTKFEEYNEDKTVAIEKADALSTPIAWVERDIENKIFVLPGNSPLEDSYKKGNVMRFSLRGFDFVMPIVPAEDEQIYEVMLKGHCNVEMNLFFGHTASITYRFLFDGHSSMISRPVVTDHIIAFLSNWLSAEFWSKEEGGEKTDINYETHFSVERIWLDEAGNPLEEPAAMENLGTGRSFDAVATRYKRYILGHCTDLKKGTPHADKKRLQSEEPSVEEDYHYAMVDVWENIQHLDKDGNDLFINDKNRPGYLTEAQIIDHIREEHKNELIGLLSLYPEEWPYRDPAAYDEVCGENIAIDTDDLVLAGSSLCVVIGTYGRRGMGEEGVNWVEHLQERSYYHVSWPEYLLILQMILAKKYIIGKATDELVLSTVDVEDKSAEKLIGENAALSMRLSQLVTQLDVVKYSKFPSHKVMFDRTTARLGLEADEEHLHQIMESVDNALHNQSDYKAMKSDFLLNVILAIISVASTFELFFQESRMPFLDFFGMQTGRLSALVVLVVAFITIFALLLVLVNTAKSVWVKFKEWTGK